MKIMPAEAKMVQYEHDGEPDAPMVKSQVVLRTKWLEAEEELSSDTGLSFVRNGTGVEKVRQRVARARARGSGRGKSNKCQIYDHFHTTKNIETWWMTAPWVFIKEIPYDEEADDFAWVGAQDLTPEELKNKRWRQRARYHRKTECAVPS